MNTLDIAYDCNLQAKKVASTHGGEYASACPVCGGNDRFRVWPNNGEHGTWWCRSCDKGGDAIELLRFAKGMSFKEACEHLGKQPAAHSRSRTFRAPKPQAADFIPVTIADPVELWQAKAAAFVEYCHKALLANIDQLAWLRQRGITQDTIKRFRLGWNDKNIWRKRSTWGVEDKTVKEKDGTEKVMDLLGLYAGLVIPYIVDGSIHRLRIRRPEGDVRYYVVPGSGMAPMTIQANRSTANSKAAWVIVESELDAILVAQDAGDIVGTAALGAVSIKPDDTLKKNLDVSAHIMVALDADKAAAKAWPWWGEHFSQADRWPVPQGKDPGDYRKAGGDIRAWVLAGLPPGLRPAPTRDGSPDALKFAREAELKDRVSATEEDPWGRPLRTYKQRCTDCGVIEEVRVYYIPKDYQPRKTCLACFNKKPKTKGEQKT